MTEILTAHDLDALRAGLRELGWRGDLADARAEIVRERLAKVPALVEQVRRLLHDLTYDETTVGRSIRETEAALNTLGGDE